MHHTTVEERLESSAVRIWRSGRRLYRKNLAFEAGITYACLTEYLQQHPHLVHRLGLADVESINDDRDAITCRDAITKLMQEGRNPTLNALTQSTHLYPNKIRRLYILYPGLAVLSEMGKRCMEERHFSRVT